MDKQEAKRLRKEKKRQEIASKRNSDNAQYDKPTKVKRKDNREWI